jgi:hypothetical protein
MLFVMLLVGVAQPAVCADEARTLREATILAQRFEVAAAAARLETAPATCAQLRMAALYLSALQQARDAYRTGGDTASLHTVTDAIETFGRASAAGDRHAELARVILTAAAAASQSERSDMALLLDHATALERRMLRDGDGAAWGITAHEVAGDLWLQVHRFEAAAAAYTAAAELMGSTPRITLGSARVAVQMRQTETACLAYRSFATGWIGTVSSNEIAEAREFIAARCEGTEPGTRRE